MLEKLSKNRQLILKKSQEFFINSSSLIPKIGCELEFFLFSKNSEIPLNQDLVENFIFEISEKLKEKFSLFLVIKKEHGSSQVEIETDFTADLLKLCDEVNGMKFFVKNFAENKNFTASFKAQPFVDDCGSALQFNISLHGNNDENIYFIDEEIVKNSASGLLSATDFMMIFLTPNQEDYLRFDFDLNRNLFKAGKFSAPVNLSFGNDNRTCAIRIPSKKNNQNQRRLEYRIASAKADPELSISSILLAISSGIKNKESKFEQIFGNAFDEKYSLKFFSKNLSDAEKSFLSADNFIKKKFEEWL